MTQDTKTNKSPLAGATVLVVEDDAEDARFAMKLVESLGGRVLHADTVRDAKALLTRTFKHKETFTTGAAREVLGTNRKTIVPLLEHFDQIGLTRRKANLRSIIFPPRSLHP